MYDFQFSVPGTYGQVCQLTDSIHNSDPIVGCHFFQAGVSFAAISWYPFSHPCTSNRAGSCGPFQWRGLSRESINEHARDRWRGIDIREKRKNEFSKVRGQHSRETISPILLYMMFRRISMPTTRNATKRFPLSKYSLFYLKTSDDGCLQICGVIHVVGWIHWLSWGCSWEYIS